MKATIAAAALAASLLFAAPAGAQQRSYAPGPLWDVASIKVEDGQFENYLDFLNRQWRDNQAYAKSQGWILDYYILSNEYPRADEPDIYLVTRYADFPSNAEIKRRDALMLEHMKSDPHALDRQSGERVKMRTLKGTMMLRELVPAH
jgi:hypothetical protein